MQQQQQGISKSADESVKSEFIKSIAARLRDSAEHFFFSSSSSAAAVAAGATTNVKEPAKKPKKSEQETLRDNLTCPICIDLFHDCVGYAML